MSVRNAVLNFTGGEAWYEEGHLVVERDTVVKMAVQPLSVVTDNDNISAIFSIAVSIDALKEALSLPDDAIITTEIQSSEETSSEIMPNTEQVYTYVSIRTGGVS